MLAQPRRGRRTPSRNPHPAPRRAPHCPPPWRAGCRHRSSRASPPAGCDHRRRRHAPSGKPPPIALAMAMISGLMPAASCANRWPVRPCRTAPRRAPAAARGCRTARAASQLPAQNLRIPPSPCTGSSRMPAVSSLLP
jgi:hypothetical protein